MDLYRDIKEFKFDNDIQLKSFYKRNCKAASLLRGYPIDRIKLTMEWLKSNADWKWTIESVGKYIDENLDELNNKGQKPNYHVTDYTNYGKN